MKDKSYTNLMKSGAMNRQGEKEGYVQNLFIEMLLREIQLRTQKEKLQQKIDTAIDKRDQKWFMELSKQLIELNKCFGT